MNYSVKTIFFVLLCASLLDSAYAQQWTGMPQKAAIFFEGNRIFDINYVSPNKCADTGWFSCLSIAKTRLFPTDHFSKTLRSAGDDDWVILSNEMESGPLDGKIELCGGTAGITWLEEVRIKKYTKSDILNYKTWMLNVKALNEVKKKRFVGRSLVSALTAPSSTGVSMEGPFIFPPPKGNQIELRKRKFTVSLLKGYLPVLQGVVESELTDPDQLWKHCVGEVLQKNVRFQKKANADLFLRGLQGREGDQTEMNLTSSKEKRLRFHVEGLGICFPNQIELLQVIRDDSSFWVVSSADRLDGENNWLIRRNLVPRLTLNKTLPETEK